MVAAGKCIKSINVVCGIMYQWYSCFYHECVMVVNMLLVRMYIGGKHVAVLLCLPGNLATAMHCVDLYTVSLHI